MHGVKRRSSLFNTERIDHLYQDPHESHVRFHLHFGDLSDSMNITRLIQEIQPDEIYNLGAMSHVRVSFDTPEYTANVDGIGTLRIMEAVRLLGLTEKTRIYQASTSELYGLVQEVPQSEKTPFYPRSPYAVAKMYAYWMTTVNYREAYNMFACNGILFNHESPLRGETFVTRKITRAVSRIALGLQKTVHMGNLNSEKIGDTKDYVEAMWLILQQDTPEDFVIATGVTTRIRTFIDMAFKHIGASIHWKGEGVNEVGVVASSSREYPIPAGQEVVKIDPKYFRPTEVDLLLGDPTKSKQKLGWQPKYDLPSLVKDMMNADLDLFKRDKYLQDAGHRTMNFHE